VASAALVDPTKACKVVTVRDDGTAVYRLDWKAKKNFFNSVGYEPHKMQRAFHKSHARTRVFCAGARGGKSYAAGLECAAHLLLPNTHWWIVATQYNLAEKEFDYIRDSLYNHPDPAFRKAIRDHAHMQNSRAQGRMSLRFPEWDSWVECKSTQDPDSLLGEELDGIIMAEGSKVKKFVFDHYIVQRLASRSGQLIFPTTPSGYDDLLYPLFMDGQDEAKHYHGDNYHSSVESWQFKSIDNPAYPMEEYEWAKRKLEQGAIDEDTFREQWGGEFVSHSGRVYRNFRPEIHVVQPYEVPRDWKLVRGIDVGLDDPTVCLIARVDQEGTIVITNEYYREGTDVSTHADNIKAITCHHDGTPIKAAYTVIDPASAQRTANNAKSVLQQYIENGIACIKADNSVDAGIMRVSEYLDFELNETGTGYVDGGAPKIHIFSNCTRLISEFGGYVWGRRRDGSKTNKPKKGNDHGLDTLRYIVMSRPSRSRVNKPTIPHPDSFRAMWNKRVRQSKKLKALG